MLGGFIGTLISLFVVNVIIPMVIKERPEYFFPVSFGIAWGAAQMLVTYEIMVSLFG